jgi:drug/metabolite transporter (DMT)-like permease
MSALRISGAILIAVGLFVLIKPPSYSREESVLKVGDIEAKLQEQRTVPSWVGSALLGAGCVLVIVGLKKSS